MNHIVKIHKPGIKQHLPDNIVDHTNELLSHKLAEYSALSGVHIIQCYNIYALIYGESKFINEGIKRLEKAYNGESI